MQNHDAQPTPAAPSLDSESWRCRGCGGQMIGRRTPDDLCRQCIVLRLTVEGPSAVVALGLAAESEASEAGARWVTAASGPDYAGQAGQ